MAATARARSGLSLEPGTLPMSPTWVAGTQSFGAENWTGSRGVRPGTWHPNIDAGTSSQGIGVRAEPELIGRQCLSWILFVKIEELRFGQPGNPGRSCQL